MSPRYDFFLAYSTRDRDFAEGLLRELGSRGTRGFMDRADVGSGAPFDEAIRLAIAASHGVIVILSKQALASNWVLAEVGIAQSMGKRIVPVVKPGESLDVAEVKHFLGADILYLDAGEIPFNEVVARIIGALEGIPVDTARSRLASARRRRSARLLLSVLLAFVAAILLWRFLTRS